MKAFLATLISTLILIAVPAQSQEQAPRILAMGDSLMAWHSVTGRSVGHVLAKELGEPVATHAVSGARILYALPISGAIGLKIAKQYRPGDWDWIVLNGGGNDLWMGCGCHKCERRMGRMISEDGRRGAIPHLVSTLLGSGAKVIYVGYLRSPGAWSPIEACRDEGEEFEARLAALSKLLPDMHFLSLADLVPHGDRSYHGLDMVHPSYKASREIAGMVAEVIRRHD
ncbi:SGNH/GDSL hydrolase family protein [Shimia sp.]|uniref:SGNH/GDSL hydrolase family protein n=1 Tax=Shimia sp. TaxID=1954381 RepID=UPI003569CEE7